jgi:glycosyltransferase involved in cell wall biosynthesis
MEQATPPGPELRLIYCGRLVREAKRIRELTEAFLRAAETPGVTATICGTGEERPWVEARLQGQNKVRYAGIFPPGEMHGIMAAHHVIVLLSDYEGLPMALVEGMACGLVPVCLDEPSGAREIIQNGVNGFIVRDRGADFARAVERWRDPEVWRRLSMEARKTVASRYSHAVVFAEWQALIQKLGATARLASKSPPRRVKLEIPRRESWFAQYSQYRPTRLESLERRIRASWMSLRLKTRPRARLRALLGPAKKR